ncbi:MAG: CDP-alcohol phosphatidyltransferase family protein [Candidatus Firestonebacteria bacterium]|nr:CDP-alcohol phosphatidyltransferase family protein [Candidatus Firestonebacteria bacterium]
MRTLTVPNFLTVLRILAVPIFIIFFRKNLQIATIIFFFAIITDVIDGVVARLSKSRTLLGSMLDPLADKLLIDTAFVLFALNNYIPDWISIVIISRDLLLIIGWLLTYILTANIKVEPSVFGKITNFFESTAVMILLLTAVFAKTYDLTIYLYLTVIMCIISLVDYSIKGIKKFG